MLGQEVLKFSVVLLAADIQYMLASYSAGKSCVGANVSTLGWMTSLSTKAKRD